MGFGDRSLFALKVLLVLAVVGIVLLLQFCMQRKDEKLQPYISTANSVKLADGREFHLVCMGSGSPTIILTGGLGDWSGSAWSTVQSAIARTTRACSWDRPGFGLSDGQDAKETVATNTSDLEAALIRRSIRGPYIMVAHSLGSYETLLFADRNRTKVVGMVLIDPSPPDQADSVERLKNRFHLSPSPPDPAIALWRKCAAEVRRRVLRADGPDPDGCLAFPASYPKAVKSALAAKLTANPAQFETAASFLADGSPEGSRLVIDPVRNYGDLPLVELTSTVHPPPQLQVRPAVLEAVQVNVDQADDALAALSARGTRVKVPGATHYIQRDRPQVVVAAIRSVVESARGGDKK